MHEGTTHQEHRSRALAVRETLRQAHTSDHVCIWLVRRGGADWGDYVWHPSLTVSVHGNLWNLTLRASIGVESDMPHEQQKQRGKLFGGTQH